MPIFTDIDPEKQPKEGEVWPIERLLQIRAEKRIEDEKKEKEEERKRSFTYMVYNVMTGHPPKVRPVPPIVGLQNEEELKNKRIERSQKQPKPQNDFDRKNPFWGPIKVNVPEEVVKGEKSWKKYWDDQIIQNTKSPEMYTPAGEWLKIPHVEKAKISNIAKGYCIEPEYDPRWMSVCTSCRVIGTLMFGALGLWFMQERLHYQPKMRMRRLHTTVGLGCFGLALSRAFDITVMDVNRIVRSWWVGDFD